MKNEPFLLHVNGQFDIQLSPEQIRTFDIIGESEHGSHVLHGGKSYHADLISADYETKTYVFRIEGNNYEVKIADHYDRLISQLGLHAGSSQKQNTVKAPMPGLVLNIMVNPGDTVEKGDPLLILEAMKMENIIKAAGEGTVKSIKVQKGAAVDKGQLLIEMA